MIEWVVERLIDLIPNFGAVAKDRRELADSALRAVSVALNETYIYQTNYQRIGRRDIDTEQQLVRYWSAAAIPLRHIDQEMASICEYKSEYWLNPENWRPENAQGLNIDLKLVRDKYRNKLKGVRKNAQPCVQPHSL